MHKLLIFDLDGTLCPFGKGMLPEDIELLRSLEASGRRIAVCSGKTVFYLCGFLRQIGLEAPILIGENGAVFQFGIDLPPRKYYTSPCSGDALDQLSAFRRKLDRLLPGRIWYQPNEIMLTIFPQDADTFDQIKKLLDHEPENAFRDLNIYCHPDCFDLVPNTISKYTGLQYLSCQEGIPASEMIAFGDGVNDIPMFRYADISIAIGNRLQEKTDYRFSTIGEAMRYVLDQSL